MNTVVLRLIGPLQAWGVQSRFGIRDTQMEPSKSGVIGIVAAALGMARTDDALLARLTQCQMVVRVDQEGRRMRDYHVTGGGTFRGAEYGVMKSDGGHKPVLSDRYYLTNAAFHVALQYADAELARDIVQALLTPVFPLTLGRRSCVPTVPIGYPELMALAAYEALFRIPLYTDGASQQSLADNVRLVVECGMQQGKSVPDVPVSFASQQRAYGIRYTKNEWHPRNAFPMEEV